MATNVFDLFAKLSLDSSDYESGLNKAKSMASTVGGGIGRGLASAAKIGITAIGAATTAVVGFGATSVKAGAEFDKSMSQVAATMGKSMDEMANEVGTVDLAWGTFSGNLRDYAQEMGKNTAFSATEAADALNYMALAGYDTQTSMEMLPNVLNLAAAGAMDLARASDMVTDTQTAFGISLERTSQMVDEMAKAASTGNTSVEQLGDAFLTVGGLAQELNGGMVTLADGTQKPVDGVQELEIALTAMANAGIKGSEAGTHMRNMLLKLSSPTDQGVAALESLGVAVFDDEGKMRSLHEILGDMSATINGNAVPAMEKFYGKFKDMSEASVLKEFKKAPEDFELFGISVVDSTGHLRDFDEVMTEANAKLGEGIDQESKIKAISDIFNTRDIASAEALLNAIDQDWDAIGESILDAQGSAQKMADTQLDNLAGDVTLFKSALEGAKIAVSDVLTPALREFVQFGTDGLSRLTSAFKEGGLSGAMTEFGDILSEGLNMIIEKLPEFITAGTKLLSALGQGLIQNMPVIIDAITQVTKIIVQALVEGMPQLISAGIEILGAIGQGIMDNLPLIVDAAIQILTMLATAILEALPQLLEAGLQIIVGLAQGIAESLPELIPTIVEVVLEIVQILTDNIGLLVQAAIALITGLAQGMIQAMPILIEQLPTIITGIVQALIDNLPLLVETIIQMNVTLAQVIVSNAPLFLEAIMQTLVAITEMILEYGGQLATQAGEIVSNVVNTVVTWLQQLPNRAAYFAGQMVGQFINFITTLPSKISETFTNIINAVQSFGMKFISEGPRMANEFKTKLVEIMRQIPSRMVEVGSAIIDGLKNGVKNAWDSFADWLSGLVDDFVDGLLGGLLGDDDDEDEGGGGRHPLAVGSDYIPYDNYPALLHKGEMVVPAKISEDLRNFIGGRGNIETSTNNGIIPEVNVTVVLEGDADRLFRVMQDRATVNYRTTGQKDLVVV